MMERLLVLVLLVVGGAETQDSPKVSIDQGDLLGTTMVTNGGRQIFAFLGIPYAAAPTGPLRYKSPQAGPRWDGVRDASKEGSVCVQAVMYIEELRNKIFGDEDCLFLNVFTPKVSGVNLPVMFFIHGGGFYSGSGSKAEYGPDLLLDRDVVLVTINYRLGPLGFLSTEDSVLPGNLGLKDQQTALRWVQQNIQNFGGDKNSVTIFGESAGGTSVHFHMLSPRSKGLFHRAISQSGTALSPYAFSTSKHQRRLTASVAELVNCPFPTSQALLDCLMKLPAHTIMGTLKHLVTWDMDPIVTFHVTSEPDDVEDAFLTADPWMLSSDLPWLVGFNKHEGAVKTISMTSKGPAMVKQLNDEFETILPMSLLYDRTASDPGRITQAIRRFYFGDSAITMDSIPQLIEMYTDAWFAASALEAARRHSGPVYFYHYTYNGSISLCNLVFQNPTHKPYVCHFEEMRLMFPMGGHPMSDEDRRVSDYMLQIWTNFAASGVPRLDNQELWDSDGRSRIDYVEIGEGVPTLRRERLLEKRDRFWQNLDYRRSPSNRATDEL